MSSPLFHVMGLTRRFGGVTAVDNVSLSVNGGGIIGLIGPNGAGKTTFFNLVSGFLRADGGAAFFEGRRIDRMAPHTIARLGLARSFQVPRILSRMSVLDNIMLSAADQLGELLGMALIRPWAVAKRERAVRARAMEVLELTRLDYLSGEFAGTLSGGQRKLLEFARILMVDPKMVLLDEPMAGVAPTLREELVERILQLQRLRNITFLVVEHDMEVVMKICDRVIVMDEGAVVADGSPDEIQVNERVIEAYLGRSAAASGTRGTQSK